MREARPHFVIFFEIGIRALQPGSIWFRSRLLQSPINIDNHRTDKRWLRASQIIGSIRIEHRAVVLNLEEEIFHHAARQLHPSGLQKATNDEITVPSVHFVESPAWHDVVVRKIKQTGWFEV